MPLRSGHLGRRRNSGLPAAHGAARDLQRIPEHFCTVQPRSIPKECSLMPTQTSPFQGIWIPLVTPFSGGAVDGGALRAGAPLRRGRR